MFKITGMQGLHLDKLVVVYYPILIVNNLCNCKCTLFFINVIYKLTKTKIRLIEFFLSLPPLSIVFEVHETKEIWQEY